MSYEYSEDGLVETATQEVLEELGWEVLTAWKKETFGTDGLLGRENKSEVVLTRYLLQALKRLNPALPETAYLQAIEQIKQKWADKTLAWLNKDKYELVKEGVPVSYTNDKGELEKKKLRVFDFENYEANHFLAVRQFEVVGELYQRRPDVVGFVNGIPLVFFELKGHHTDLRNVYMDNITDYKDTIPAIFHCNAFIILSNGTDAKVGTVTSPYKFFLDWKRITEEEEGIVSLDTILQGTCGKQNLMDIFENFLLFDDSGGEVVKIMAKNHQFIGVNKVIDQPRNFEEIKGKLGVFWHTQGSGKSYSKIFVAQKIHRKFGGAYTFLIVVDRSELERQLYDTFTALGANTSKEVVAKNREHLRDLLKENHQYVFSLIHKFSIDPKMESEYPLITDRKNIIVISDEAHRTQSGTFARNMRFHGIPNASYLGFTGTPIIKDEEELTKNIFGEYVSVYDFKRAIEDGATLPLRYLNKGEKLGLVNPGLDIATHRRKMADRDLEKEFKDENNPFRLAIVCAMWITAFDARYVSTVYLDKPIKGHTLMQTIARANRVYDDEKENGLIVDYGNVYKQLEKAYAIYGEGGSKGGADAGSGGKGERPVELLEELAEELKESIRQAKGYLKELGFELGNLSNTNAKPLEKLAHIKKAVDCICLNETTRAKFEIMSREVFRKYKALYPEEQVKPFIRQFNAIEAIYQQLNQQTKSADVSAIIANLQLIVNESITVERNEVHDPDWVYVDLSKLDFDKLRAAFAKTEKKNTVLFDLQRAVDQKL